MPELAERGVQQPPGPEDLPALALEVGGAVGHRRQGRPQPVGDVGQVGLEGGLDARVEERHPPAVGHEAAGLEPDVVAPAPGTTLLQHPGRQLESLGGGADDGQASRTRARRDQRAGLVQPLRHRRQLVGQIGGVAPRQEQDVEVEPGPAGADSVTSAPRRPGSASGRDPTWGRTGSRCSSTTTWALMPPKPKALTPARRGSSLGRPRLGLGRAAGTRCRPGRDAAPRRAASAAATPWCTASTALISPAAPAAGMAWPIIDFTDPSTRRGSVRPTRRPGRRGAASPARSSSPGAGGRAVRLDQARPCSGSSPASALGPLQGQHLAAHLRAHQAGAAAVAGHARCRG